MKRLAIFILSLLLMISCSRPSGEISVESSPAIFPDYTDIVIPCNIAPLNFKLEGASSFSVVISSNEAQYSFRSCGQRISFPLRRWRKLMNECAGQSVEVFVTSKEDGQKITYKPFFWEISPEKIDSYISYRLIEPAYEVWNVLSVEERCTENFDARYLAKNSTTGHSCMNCHTSNRAPVHTTFLHARSAGGATLYQRDGKIRKVNTATDSTAGAAVYGEISQDGRWGIFTTADIRNGLHSAALERFEVFDDSSDLILVDFENNTVTDSPLVKGPEFQETFPCWSADNRTVYFCRSEARKQPEQTKQMHYDIYSISFDPQTGKLGDKLVKVFDATARGKSTSLLKCSPDGTKLLFCASDYGTFPIWHIETDLWMLDLRTGEIDQMEQTNGEFSDSYHCWSSNGRWICFASKRDDRVYGRPYFAFVREDGTTTKAFVLPQRNPNFYLTTFKSFNIPELYDTPEPYGARDMRKFYFGTQTEQMTYSR